MSCTVQSNLSGQGAAAGQTQRSLTRFVRKSVKPIVFKLSRKLSVTFWPHRRLTISRLLMALLAPFIAAFAPEWALAGPSGAQVTAGAASVSQASALTTQITQTTPSAVINWKSFSIDTREAVNITQPTASSVLLNRVTGGDPSRILGSLTANGQIFLVNGAGVYVAPGASVNVGGLVASSMNITDSHFAAAKYQFDAGINSAAVVNEGQLTGRYVVLSAPQVTNTGSIEAPSGSIALGAGGRVNLTLMGGNLVSLSVDAVTANAAILNSGNLRAEGGKVFLTARSSNAVLDTVINTSGIVRASSLVNRNGVVVIDGGAAGVVQVGGSLDAAGVAVGSIGGTVKVLGPKVGLSGHASVDVSGDAGGGTVLIGGNFHGAGPEANATQVNIDNGVHINADAITRGDGGKVAVWADGVTRFAGNISAKGGASRGDGGFVETSGKGTLDFTGFVNTSAAKGQTGTLLLDPTDITITDNDSGTLAYNNGIFFAGTTTASNLKASRLEAVLVNSNAIVFTGSSGTGTGAITVAAPVSWNANRLTLNATTNININAALNGSGTASLALQYGQGAVAAGNASNYHINAPVNLPAGSHFSTLLGTDGTVKHYTVITSLGASGSTTAADLQGINGNPSGNYALGSNIDASVTASWNSGAGFMPIGSTTDAFTGNFDGLFHSIGNLYINRPSTSFVGLFGFTGNAPAGTVIRNVGLVGGSTKASSWVGALVGEIQVNSVSVSNSYSTSDVSGVDGVGGLVGYSNGAVSNSFATGAVTGSNYTGGLIGASFGIASNNYAIGNVTGTNYAGGLIGLSASQVNYSYATGKVLGQNSIGGLIGSQGGSVTSSYWNSDKTSTGIGIGSPAGSTGRSTAALQSASSFSNWSIAASGSSGSVWRIYEGHTAPLLAGFLTALKLDDASNVYNGLSQNGLGSGIGDVTIATGKNVGSYTAYSNQQGYDITGGNLAIYKAALGINAAADTRTYTGATNSAGLVTYTGLVGSDSVSGATQSFASKNASGLGQSTLSVNTGFVINDGNAGANYHVTLNTAVGTISKAALVLSASTDARTYTGGTDSTGVVTVAGMFGTDSITATRQSFASKNVLGSGQSTLSVNAGYVVNDGNSGGNYHVTTHVAAGTINKAALAIHAVGDARTYTGGTESAGVVTVAGLIGPDSITATSQSFASKNVLGSGQSTLAVNAGYVINDGNAGGNYQVTQGSAAGTITQAALGIHAVTDSKTYSGDTSSAVSVNVTGLVGGDTVSDAGQAFGSKNVLGVGQSTLAPNAGYRVNDGNSGANYSVTRTTAAGTITPAALIINANTDSKVYSGDTHSEILVGITGLVGGDTVSGASQSFVNKNVVGVGESTLTVNPGYVVNDGNSGGNYSVSSNPAAGTISKAALVLSAVTDARTYNAGTNSAGTVTVTGLAEGDSVSAASQSFDSKNVLGINQSTLSVNAGYGVNDGNSGGNYQVSTNGAYGTISKAALTINAATDARIYNGGITSAGTVVVTGLLGADSVTAASQSFGSKHVLGTGQSTLAVNAGYVINDGNSGGNYQVTKNSAAGTISPAALGLHAVTDSKTYSGDTSSAISVNIMGLVGGDTVSGASQSFVNKNVVGVGESTLTVNPGYVVNDGNSGGNYSVSSNPAAGTISKAALVLSAVTDARTYNAGTSSAGTVTVAGLAVGDSVTAASQSFGSKHVLGTGQSMLAVNAGYVINDGNSGGNYQVTKNSAAGTISPAALGIHAVTDSKTYSGDTSSAISVSITGLVGGDTVSGASQSFVNKNVVGVGESTLTVNPGYVVNDGNSGGNYSVSSNPAAGTISKAALVLSAVTDARTYNAGTSSAGTVTVTGLVKGDSVSAASQSFDSKNVLGINQSTLSVNAGYGVNDGNSGANYQVSTNGAAGTISKAALAINAVTDSRTYNGVTSSAGAVSFTGLLGTDSVTAASQSFDSKNVMGAGQSSLSVNSGYVINDGNLGGNYQVSKSSAAGTISKAALSINAVTDTKIYSGDVNSAAAVRITGLVGTDSISGANQSFGSKNVLGLNASTISVNNHLVINDGNNSGGNYAVNVGSAMGTITRLASVTWIGASSGNWSLASNWAANAIPDLANVQQVIIPAGKSVLFDSNVGSNGSVQLESINNMGTLTVNSGTLTVSGSLAAVSSAQTDQTNVKQAFIPAGKSVILNGNDRSNARIQSDSVSGLGALAVNSGTLTVVGDLATGSYVQRGGNVSAGSLNASNNFRQTDGSLMVGGNLNINQASGAVMLGNASSAALSVTSSGDILQIAASALTVAGATTLTAGTGTIVLKNSGNDFGAALTLTSAAADIADLNSLSLSGGVAGNLTLHSAALTFGTTVVAGNMVATTTGAVAQTGALSVAGSTDIAAAHQRVTLAQADNNFGGPVSARGDVVSINANNVLNLGTVTAQQASLSAQTSLQMASGGLVDAQDIQLSLGLAGTPIGSLGSPLRVQALATVRFGSTSPAVAMYFASGPSVTFKFQDPKVEAAYASGSPLIYVNNSVYNNQSVASANGSLYGAMASAVAPGNGSVLSAVTANSMATSMATSTISNTISSVVDAMPAPAAGVVVAGATTGTAVAAADPVAAASPATASGTAPVAGPKVSFGGVRLSTMSQDAVAGMLAERDRYKKALFADAISKLEQDVSLADLPPCTSSADIAEGKCLVTEALKQKLQSAPSVASVASVPQPLATPSRTAVVAGSDLPPVNIALAQKRKVKSSALPQIERKVAIVIGVDAYQDERIPQLSNAVNDARSVASLFESSLGYETVVIANATKPAVVSAMNKLALELGPRDSVIVYYAGHGELVEATGLGYWQLADSDATQPQTWLSNADINRMVAQIGASQVALISDSCYSGALVSNDQIRASAAGVDAKTLLTRKSVVVMSSGGNEPVADDARDGHSPFAWNLMNELKQVSNWQAGGNVFARVRFAVARELPQRPKYGSSSAAGHQDGGDYLFERRQLEVAP